MSNRTTNILATILLVFLFVISVFSMMGDSLTFDEKAHLPAGYSYVKKLDMRLNPEHPPIIKSLSGIPLLFMDNINFPSDSPSWQEKVNGQWSFGNEFLYESNNPAEKMIFWGRFPMVLVLLLLGYYIFKVTRELFGNKAGIISLLFFSFSPTFIAHGRLVTTDIGAALGIFIAIYYFVKMLKNYSTKNLVIAGFALGIAQLLKFTSVFLVPFFVIIGLFWWWAREEKLMIIAKRVFIVFVIAFLLIGAVYQIHIRNYPHEKQISDLQTHQELYPLPLASLRATAEPAIRWMAKTPYFRQYAYYLTGVSIVTARTGGGNTTYFLGEVSASGWPHYFPFVYLIKLPLAFHLLTLLALIYGFSRIKKPYFEKTCARFKNWIKNNLFVFTALSFITIYWLSSLNSPLNIGVRHLLPIFPLIFTLVAGNTSRWLKDSNLKKYLVGALILWQVVTVIKVYPHFISYFNELVGGPSQGYKYTIGSNVDWGQDLIRLKEWTEKENIDTIYIDYFGGSSIDYHFSEEKLERWWGSRDPKELPDNSYLAISVTFLKQGQGKATPDYDGETGYYRWLEKYDPIKKIGHSIFVYKIDKK